MTGILAATDDSNWVFGTGELIAILAVLAAAVGVALALVQLRAARTTAMGQFVLSLDQTFLEDEPIRERNAKAVAMQKAYRAEVEKGGKPKHKPEERFSVDEWRQIKRYMARLERVNVLLDEGQVTTEVAYRLYASRMAKLVENAQIRSRLLLDSKRQQYWLDFIELWRVLDGEQERRNSKPLCATAVPPTLDPGRKKERSRSREDQEEEPDDKPNVPTQADASKAQE